jgi:superfamily I DNA/RNA helicase
VGDRGWTDEVFDEAISPTDESREKAERTEVKSIFRCSPDIVNLAFSVTSAGATLFTNFDDPLKMASSMFTADEERKSVPPQYISCGDDSAMVALAFARADQLAKELDVTRSEIALVAFTQDLFRLAEEFAATQNKAVELLKQRGDIDVVNLAKKSSRFILSTPEYIGGLEFQAVVLFGVDDGRVPPVKTSDSADSVNFLNYSSHNRLYVAITRARFRIEILGAKDRGPSALLKGALERGILMNATC